MLLGRDPELRAIDRALADARLGRSAALVIRGDAGIGKTSLLRYAVQQASAMRVLQARGVEFEADVPFAALHELLRPAYPWIDHLPAAHAAALRSSLGLGARREADRLLVGAATLGLLTGYAEEAPLLVVLDDAHWLDPASAEALAFAARRLLADPVALLASIRMDEQSALSLAGLPELVVSGLDRAAAAALLERTAGPIPPAVARSVLAATAGNPLAVVELAAEAASLGVIQPDSPLPIATTVERAYLRRAVDLSEGARSVLLLIAAAGAAEVEVFAAAAAILGLEREDVAAAEAATGLVAEREGRVDFVHPLARAAVYHAAAPADRREAHRALAEVLTSPEDADRRAWHLAAGALGRDARAAEALAEAGSRARGRTAYAAAAAAFAAAARLTVGAELRASRLLAAAENAWLAGQVAPAVEFLESARELAQEQALRLQIDNLTGHIAMRQGSVREGLRTQLATADALRTTDPVLAARIVADAALATYGAGYPDEVWPAALAALELLGPDAPPEVAVVGQVACGALAVLGGHGAEGPRHLRAALELFGRIDVEAGDPQVLVAAGIAGTFLREAEAGRDLLARAEAGARGSAPTAALPAVLFLIARDAAATERWSEARAYYEEAIRIARETSQFTWLAGLLGGLGWLSALEGREQECRQLAAEAEVLCERYEMGFWRAWVLMGLGQLELGVGRPEAALQTLSVCQEVLSKVGIRDPDLAPAPDLVDAHLRLGHQAEARAAAAGYDELAAAKGQPFALARAARVRGLLAPEAGFAEEFEAALRHHAGTPDTFELARTQLCYGERLRRARRRVEARAHLRAAMTAFDRLGAAPWAERASSELTASGETARLREEGHRQQLTPQELQVGLALAEGLTTREAAAKLYLSPKTVEYHLRNVYDKLEIRSREELAARLRPAVMAPKA
ncbi:MAG TPA: LuxR family transcriptional regulator [Candidatus Dormibacteraeota bacterium]